ncbi:MAG TPA: radical SAM protein [Oligoflexia bacterium]|mgnify:CR=1 FL=1|nr:radical SAM protein [Oligoflexia bacterium]HMR24499.1 radical SAM protein [Oligoflexia bacterium]
MHINNSSAASPLKANNTISMEVSPDEKDPQSALKKALKLALTEEKAEIPKLQTTRYRTLTKRGVMWLGQTCNLRCHFCYFLDRIEIRTHPEHPFMSLEKAKKICHTLVHFYGNNAIDIQGGEPTIWKDILPLVSYCNEIGLYPTLITNALVLAKKEKCQAFKDAGLRDFLVSVHGIGDVHDRVVQMPGAHEKQMHALRNMQEVGIPFRFNCVLSKPVINQLPQIAELAVKTGASVVNFLAFNPFEDQAKDGKRSAYNVPKYSDIMPKLNEALDILHENKVEANVRYYPLCMTERRHLKSMYNFQQLPYDHHEWDYASWNWTGIQEQRMKGGETTPPYSLTQERKAPKNENLAQKVVSIPVFGFVAQKLYRLMVLFSKSVKSKDSMYRDNARVRAEDHCGYQYSKRCNDCSVKNICDGFHGDYADLFGTEEANPIVLDHATDDPKRFISEQDKWVEQEDLSWALKN